MLQGRTRVLSLRGQVTEEEIGALSDHLAPLIDREDGLQVVLDLGEARWLSSSAFGMLTSLMQEARKANGDVRIARARDHVISVFVHTQLNRVFKLYKSVDEAVASFAESVEQSPPGGGPSL